MRWCVYDVGSLVASIMILAMVGCRQENSVEKTGIVITEYTQGAIDKAKGVGKTLEDAAEKTAEQMKAATESLALVPPWECRQSRGMELCRTASPSMMRRGAGHLSLSHQLFSVLPLSAVREHQVQPDHNEGAQDIHGPFPQGVIDTVDQDCADERVVD